MAAIYAGLLTKMIKASRGDVLAVWDEWIASFTVALPPGAPPPSSRLRIIALAPYQKVAGRMDRARLPLHLSEPHDARGHLGRIRQIRGRKTGEPSCRPTWYTQVEIGRLQADCQA